MKTYRIIEKPKMTGWEYSDFGGEDVLTFNDISDLEFSLLISDAELDINKYKTEDFVYAKLKNGIETYVLRSEIEETEYFTKQEVLDYSLDLLNFLTKHREIHYNPVIEKWNLPNDIGFQTNNDLIRFFEASKSSINLDQYNVLLQNMRENTFHMNDEQAKEIVDESISYFPDLLKYRDLEWFYKYV